MQSVQEHVQQWAMWKICLVASSKRSNYQPVRFRVQQHSLWRMLQTLPLLSPLSFCQWKLFASAAWLGCLCVVSLFNAGHSYSSNKMDVVGPLFCFVFPAGFIFPGHNSNAAFLPYIPPYFPWWWNTLLISLHSLNFSSTVVRKSSFSKCLLHN